MRLFSQFSSPLEIQATIETIFSVYKVRIWIFSFSLALLLVLRFFYPISFFVFLVVFYFFLTTLISYWLVLNYKEKRKELAYKIVTIETYFLYPLELFLYLIVIYFLSPFIIFLFGNSLWLALFFYAFSGIGIPTGVTKEAYQRSKRFTNFCFFISLICTTIVAYWEYKGIFPYIPNFPQRTSFLYQNLISTILFYTLIVGVFLVGKIFISSITEKNFLLSQQISELNATLEKKVKERTQELEDMKNVLEIKIAAKTKALRELAESLELKVKERTKELEKRVRELEKFQKLIVGRELKMIQLKKELEELKQKLK